MGIDYHMDVSYPEGAKSKDKHFFFYTELSYNWGKLVFDMLDLFKEHDEELLKLTRKLRYGKPDLDDWTYHKLNPNTGFEKGELDYKDMIRLKDIIVFLLDKKIVDPNFSDIDFSFSYVEDGEIKTIEDRDNPIKCFLEFLDLFVKHKTGLGSEISF